jgi:5-aminolevulinate synthase
MIQEQSMDYRRFFEDAIDQLHAEKRYRVFANLERIVGKFPELGSKNHQV